MNNMCLSCPRYMPGYIYPENVSPYDSHRCPGTTNTTYTGCIRRPYNPLASVLDLVYNVDTEAWERRKKPAPVPVPILTD